MTAKFLAITEARGNLVRVVLPPHRRRDTIGVASLIQDVGFLGQLGDKVFDLTPSLLSTDAAPR